MKHDRTSSRLTVFAAAMLTMTLSSNAKAELFATDTLKLYGDFRARLETDWDSQSSSGSDRDDRSRLRIRARVGLSYDPNGNFSYGVRLRTGSDDSHQSPHVTVLDFDDNDTGDADINFDKWYLKAKRDKVSGWVGRNSFPFWTQNELIWDDDATPAGVAVGFKTAAGNNADIAINAGYFSAPVGMQEFAGNLGAAQLVFSTKVRDVSLTLAGGVFNLDENEDDSDAAALLNGNGMRDYTIWIGNIQAKWKTGNIPLTFGLDIMHNSEDYSDTDVDPFFPAADDVDPDDTDGYVLSLEAGALKAAGNWLGAYYFARIETFAVNASYAQDDWVRWGSATQTRSSNMQGHELRLARAFAENMNIVARLYIVDAITNKEDGTRFRVDFNYMF